MYTPCNSTHSPDLRRCGDESVAGTPGGDGNDEMLILIKCGFAAVYHRCIPSLAAVQLSFRWYDSPWSLSSDGLFTVALAESQTNFTLTAQGDPMRLPRLLCSLLTKIGRASCRER